MYGVMLQLVAHIEMVISEIYDLIAEGCKK